MSTVTSPPTSPPPRRSHQLGSEEPRVLLGLRWPELVALGLLLGTGLLVLSARKDPTGVLLGLALAAIGGVLAWGRHGGLSLAVWAGIAIRQIAGTAIGQHQWRRRVTHGTYARERGRLAEHVELPGELGRLRLLETTLHEDGTGPRIGAFHDRRADTYTATLLVRATGNFGLLGHTDQDRKLADWAGALEELARDQSPIRRVAWVERTLPEPSDALADHLHEHRDQQLSLDLSPVRSYLELLDQAATATDHHELLISLQITGRAARRHARGRGWTRQETALRVLAGELDLAAQALQHAGLDVRQPLDSHGLVTSVRLGLDPWTRPGNSGAQRPRGPIGDSPSNSTATTGVRPDGPDEGALAGMAREASWDHVLWDRSQHVTCWIAGWPRQPVRSMFLAPLLMRSDTTRAVAVVMELLGPDRGLRQAETTVADDESAESLRWRSGMRTRRRVAKREQANRAREDELADGHIDIRFTGFVSIAVPANAGVHARHQALDRIRAQAARCGLRLEVMHGQQPEGLTFVLPLARGLA